MEKPLKRQNFYAKGWKFSPWRDILKPSRKGGVQNENHENQPEQEGHSRTRGWTSPESSDVYGVQLRTPPDVIPFRRP